MKPNISDAQQDHQRVNEHFEYAYAYGLVKRLVTHINKAYFRVRLEGFDNLPVRSPSGAPLIFASNHSGMAFPWDAISFSAAMLEQADFNIGQALRPLTSPALSRAYFMSPFLIDNFWRKSGGVDATTANYHAMMQLGESNILIYPEGVPGIGKGFNRKYQLQRVATSTLRMCLKYRADIIPVATVNGEYINPFSYSIDKLNYWAQRIGMPFFPCGPSTLLIPFQPWFFYFAFPANLVFVCGDPIRPYDMIGGKALEEVTESDIQQLNADIQKLLQQNLDQAVTRYGHAPYGWRTLLKGFWRHRRYFWNFMPLAWTSSFIGYDQEFSEQKTRLQQQGLSELQVEEGLCRHFDETAAHPIRFWELLRNLVRHPKSLLLYLPLVGLVRMFLYRPALYRVRK